MPDSATRRIAAAAAARVLGTAAEHVRVSAIAGGAEARSFKVEIGRDCVFAKLPDMSVGLTLASADEYRVLERLAAGGLTPRPIGLDVDSGVVISEFVASARALRAHELSAAGTLEAIARALRELHAIALPLRAYEPLGFAQHYASRAHLRASPEAQRMLGEIVALASRCAPAIAGGAVCHNDLHAGNILVEATAQGPRVSFTDFEYAVTAAPIVDLASFAALNRLPPASLERFLSAYHEGEEPAVDTAAFGDIVRMHELLAGLWKLARNDNNEPTFAARDERMKGKE